MTAQGIRGNVTCMCRLVAVRGRRSEVRAEDAAQWVEGFLRLLYHIHQAWKPVSGILTL